MKHRFLEGTLVLTKDRTQMSFNDGEFTGMNCHDVITVLDFINKATDNLLKATFGSILNDNIDSSPRPMVLLTAETDLEDRLACYKANAVVGAHPDIIDRVCRSFESLVNIPEMVDGKDNSNTVVVYIAIDMVDGNGISGSKLAYSNGIFNSDDLLDAMVTFKSRFLTETVKRCK